VHWQRILRTETTVYIFELAKQDYDQLCISLCSCPFEWGSLILLPQSDFVTTRYSVLQIFAVLIHQFFNTSKNKQKHGIKMEKLCYFQTSFYGKIDSSLIAYILFEDTGLNIAMVKL
jgi:hypothetical protein